MRYVLERRLGLPVTPIPHPALAPRRTFSDYDVLLGARRGSLEHWAIAGQRTIRDFVRKPAAFWWAVGDSVETFNGGDEPRCSAVKREAALGREPGAGGRGCRCIACRSGRNLAKRCRISARRSRDQRALPDTPARRAAQCRGQRDHFLSAGYDGGAVVAGDGTRDLSPPLGRE